MMRFQAAIFDLDGTLIDSLADLAAAMNIVLLRRGFPQHDLAAYRGFIGHGMRNLVTQALPEEARTPEILEASFQAFYAEYSEHCLELTQPYPGIAEALAGLTAKNITLAVLSNKQDELTQKIVAHLFSSWRFAAVLGTKPDLPRKPDPQGALRISAQLAIPPQDILYLGDSGVDMQTAVSAGMFPAGVLWGYRSEQELLACGAQRLLSSPLEIPNLF